MMQELLQVLALFFFFLCVGPNVFFFFFFFCVGPNALINSSTAFGGWATLCQSAKHDVHEYL